MRSSKLKHACCSKFWIEYTDIGRKCQESTKIRNPLYLNAA